MNPNDMMSPVRKKLPRADGKGTPARAERRVHQPSPNRTEAAAAMMHLLTSSTDAAPASSKVHKRPPGPSTSGKVKRRYVRKALKKVNTSVKAEMKAAWSALPPKVEAKKAPSAHPGEDAGEEMKASSDGQLQGESNGEGKGEGEDGHFFPYREYNRKEKSLGLLCENFLKLYRGDVMTEICLDKAAAELGVERRRIYDIVNILESIFLVSRKSKNLYNWHGLQCLPSSIVAMKKRYEETLAAASSGSGVMPEYSFKGKDRRRGKSLSKLSQMFVQLFLVKEHCIIPLDQAAKQLIQSEHPDNEEDRQLKTKIRRLYDVANVLVSVGLIEKLQLSNCRKPVFRWKARDASAPMDMSESVGGEDELVVKTEVSSDHDFLQNTSTVDDKAPAVAVVHTDDTDAFKTSQSCDSDMSEDDGSDSQSDSSNDTGSKRKLNDLDAPDSASSEDEVVAKRPRSKDARPAVAEAATPAPTVLCMDSTNTPVHPRDILLQKEQELRVFMQQYVKEYAEYLMTLSSSPTTSSAAASVTTRDVHSTPVTLPSLASSVDQMLLTESPQSVEMLPTAIRVDTKTLPAIATSPVAAAGESTADASPQPLLFLKKQVESGAAKVEKTVEDDVQCYNASVNLIRALQPPPAHS